MEVRTRPCVWFALLASNLCLASNVAFAQSAELPPLQWRVSAQFPQQRVNLPSRESRWRDPTIMVGDRVVSALPGADEDPDDWYNRISVGGESPYARIAGTYQDLWQPGFQRYDPKFIEYVVSNSVFVTVTAPRDIACRWMVDGKPVFPQPGCGDVELKVPTTGAEVLLLDGTRPIARSHIRPKRMIVLGLGDSYAAGEGNPDRATRWDDKPVSSDLGWLRHRSDGDNPHVLHDAVWRDPTCHRSFWNHQAFTAMRLAAEDPKREVVFLQFACSGAEILDGMLVRQFNPPGIGETSKSGCSAGESRRPECRVRQSQLAAAVTALCTGAAKPDAALVDKLDRKLKPHTAGPQAWQKMDAYREGKRVSAPYGLDLPTCVGTVKKPDLVLLSVGGNDAGFANLVAWALMPPAGFNWFTTEGVKTARWFGVVCPDDVGRRGCRRPYANTYAAQLEGRFDVLGEALAGTGLVVDPRRVVIGAYPNPLRKKEVANGASLQLCSDSDMERELSPWHALNVDLPGVIRRHDWTFLLRNGGSGQNGDAADVLDQKVLPTLRRHHENGARRNGYTYVDGTEGAFLGRSWCDETEEERMRLALPSSDGTGWPNHSPASWRPYARRARAIRTANDAYLTQLSKRSGDKNGAMHPTAEGQLLLADPIYTAARNVGDTTATANASP